MYRISEYKRLHVGWTLDESPIWICTLRATADHFGWSSAQRYQYVARPSQGYPGFPRYIVDIPHRQWVIGGQRLRICRSPFTGGFPKGLTHSFRVSEHVTNFDIAELAHLTQGDWHWMTDRIGRRISRERWLERYAIGVASGKGTPRLAVA